VATSGRAFWILDDLSPLQQTLGRTDFEKARIFQPKPTVKFTVNTPASPPPNEGQNPPSGVVFDYFLPQTWSDSAALTLVISDVFQNTIRTYSNKKDEDFKSWPGGPPPPAVLPARAGMNRFHWDLRRETLPAVEGLFVMGDYRGHLVAPGDYLFKLMSDTDTSVTMVKILPDPRLRSDLGEHGNQQVLLLQIEQGVKDIHTSVNRLRAVKTQLKDRLDALKKTTGHDDLIALGEKAMKDIEAWESGVVQPKQETFQDVINFPNRINAQLLSLKSEIDAHEPKPTQGAVQRLKDLANEWAEQKRALEKIIKESVGGFNDAWAKAQLPVLIFPEK